jgi:hypothetical protein
MLRSCLHIEVDTYRVRQEGENATNTRLLSRKGSNGKLTQKYVVGAGLGGYMPAYSLPPITGYPVVPPNFNAADCLRRLITSDLP